MKASSDYLNQPPRTLAEVEAARLLRDIIDRLIRIEVELGALPEVRAQREYRAQYENFLASQVAQTKQP